MLEVTRTYLEMTAPAQLRRAGSPDPLSRVERVVECPTSFYRYLYREVGRRYHWVDRLDWGDAQLRAHLADVRIGVWAMYVGGAPAGFFELRQDDDGSVEIAYFGLLPEFIGRGLGKQLLTEAVDRAWALRPRRVWLHTCTLDDPAALPNYLKRGFVPYREERYLVARGEATRAAPSP